jgi:AbrB family looped-hinge helix DNA binding protein
MMAHSEQIASTVEPLRKGQVNIPAEFREKLGIKENSLLCLTLTADKIEITPVTTVSGSEPRTWVQELYAMFAPVREDARELTETEVDALIDEAVAEVRAKRD